MAWFLIVIAAAIQVLQAPQVPPAKQVQQAPIVSVRFHHLHYRVRDPLQAMHRAAGAGDQGPTILQGLGVGVRVGAEYVLFDRLGNEAAPPPITPVAAAYPKVVAWLRGLGMDVSSDVSRVVEISAGLSGAWFDHLAFATPNMPGTLAHLARAGVRVSKRNDESVMVDNAVAGLRIEIVRDADLPDLLWCPMHPDVRSAVAGVCPICRMTLVPIPAPQIGEYRMDLTPLSGARAGGISGLRVTIGHPGSGSPATSFISMHDKRLHLFIVSRDLDYFAHVHPDQAPDGSFVLRHAIPPGEYMVMADFLPADGAPQMVQRAMVTPGYDPAAHGASAGPAQAASVVAGGVRATWEARDLRAGRTETLRFTLANARTGAPVTDLEPYLSAPAHALLVSADLTFAVHGHPREQDAFAPTLSFEFLTPAPGLYKVWLQVQRRGQVLTLPFVVRVGS